MLKLSSAKQLTSLLIVRFSNHQDNPDIAFDTLRTFGLYIMSCDGASGMQVIKATTTSDQYTLIVRFSSQEKLTLAITSAEFKSKEEALATYTTSSIDVQKVAGIEGWFTPKGNYYISAPPKWKMASLLLVGVYTAILPVSTLLNMSEHFQHFPAFIKVALNTLIVVPCMTWGIMPVLTKIFDKWLHSL